MGTNFLLLKVFQSRSMHSFLITLGTLHFAAGHRAVAAVEHSQTCQMILNLLEGRRHLVRGSPLIFWCIIELIVQLTHPKLPTETPAKIYYG
jgi:hypothetical protein